MVLELSTIRKAVEDLQRRGEPVSVRRVHQRTGGSFRDILAMLKIVNVHREMNMNGHGPAALSIQDQDPEPAPDRGQLALADLVIADAQDAAAAIWHTIQERQGELKAAQSGAAQAEVDGNIEALTAHLARVTALDLIIDRLRLQVTAAEDEVRKRQAARDQLLKRSREINVVLVESERMVAVVGRPSCGV